ncbi:MAG: HD domain-containing phosphohydrolase [Coriobacteriia bacterium]|nr:HD domain-containing phosphohydrolase [Coriobacteriia bacterium]
MNTPDQSGSMLTPYVRLLVSLVDDRQPGYARHANSVARLSCSVGSRLGFDESQLEQLRVAALLHDVGQLRVPVVHVGSRWDLAADERRLWETHPEHGAGMATALGLPADVALAIRGHHERWDGSGYPKGLSRARISLYGRILGACDVFDGACMGLEGTRGVRLTQDEALELLIDDESSRFDEVIVSVLREVIEDEQEIGALLGMCV